METKYTVYTETFEFDIRKYNNPEEAYFARTDFCPKQIALCDTLEEAKEIIATINVSTVAFANNKTAGADVAFIEEGNWEQDEDGEWQFIDGGDCWEFKCAELKKYEED